VLTRARAVGLATAHLFKAHGATVIITASTPESFKKAKAELTGFDIVQCDVASLKELDALYAHIKQKYPQGLDIVFANAGIAHFVPSTSVDEAHYDKIMDINVKGLYFTVQKAFPLLNAGSAVVLNASVVSRHGLAGASVYAASKAAVRSFARTWTAEVPPTQTRFNVLSPGYTVTPILDKNGMGDEAIKAISLKLPMKRFATADESAKAALFLASSDSSYVAGADLMVDGGFDAL